VPVIPPATAKAVLGLDPIATSIAVRLTLEELLQEDAAVGRGQVGQLGESFPVLGLSCFEVQLPRLGSSP